MSGSQTNGFDLVFEMSERRLQQILEPLIPATVTQSFTLPQGQSVTVLLRGRSLSRVTIAPEGRLSAVVGFTSILLAGLAIGGADVTLDCTIGDDGNSPRRIVVGFPTAPVIVLREPDRLAGLLAVLGPDAPTLDQALTMAAEAILGFLRGNVALPPVPLNVPFGTGPCTLSLSDLKVHTMAGAAALLLSVSGAGIPHSMAPNAAAFTAPSLEGRDAIMMVSNESLLSVAACFASTAPSPLAGATFAPSLDRRTLTAPLQVTVDGTTLTLDSLSFSVEGGRIAIDGAVTMRGLGYSVSGPIHVPVGFSCRPDGTIALEFNPADVRTGLTVSLEWWVYLLAFGAVGLLGVLLGPLVGLVAGIVVALAAPILSVLANAVAQSAISGAGAAASAAVEAGFRMAPPELLMVLGQLRCENILLDDLTLGGVLDPPAARPSLQISPTWVNTQDVVIETGNDGTFPFTVHRLAHRGTLRAYSHGLRGPVSYAWTLHGQALGASGTVTVGGVAIAFTTAGDSCTLSTPLGATVSTDLRVRATDRGGFSLVEGALIDVKGIETRYDTTSLDALRYLERCGVYLQGHLLPRGPGCPDPPLDVRAARDIRLDTALAIGRGMGMDVKALLAGMGHP